MHRSENSSSNEKTNQLPFIFGVQNTDVLSLLWFSFLLLFFQILEYFRQCNGINKCEFNIYSIWVFFYCITFVGKCKHATFLVCSSVAKQQTMTDHIIKGVRSSSLGMAEGGE